MFFGFHTRRSLALACAGFIAGCGTTTGGGGGGLAAIPGGACHGAIGETCYGTTRMTCTNDVWFAISTCATGTTCTESIVSPGQPGKVTACAAISGVDVTSTSDGDAGGQNDGSSDSYGLTDASQEGSDAVEDVPIVVDIGPPPEDVKADSALISDVQKDSGIKDIAYDVQAYDVGKDSSKSDLPTVKPTWGSCQINAAGCTSQCMQSECSDAYAQCNSSAECASYFDCELGCGSTPLKMPPQTTPVQQLPGEDTQTYCYRICETQATGVAVALNQVFEQCAIGACLDCASSSNSIIISLCKSSCGAFNNCGDFLSACEADTDCMNVFGCTLKCPSGNTTCQSDCLNNAMGNGKAEFIAYSQCGTKNQDACVAP